MKTVTHHAQMYMPLPINSNKLGTQLEVHSEEETYTTTAKIQPFTEKENSTPGAETPSTYHKQSPTQSTHHKQSPTSTEGHTEVHDRVESPQSSGPELDAFTERVSDTHIFMPI